MNKTFHEFPEFSFNISFNYCNLTFLCISQARMGEKKSELGQKLSDELPLCIFFLCI